MGGKPWTSKGCVNCRKRKIKCDEQRPECGRCRKSRIKCLGWEAYRNFVGASSMPEARRQKINNLPESKPSRSDTSATSSAAPLYPRGPRLALDVHPAQAMRAQVFGSFVQHYVSDGSISSSNNFDDPIFRNIGSIAQNLNSQMTERALSALSCLFLGKTNHNPSIFNHGVYLYQTTIRQLSNMLRWGSYTSEVFYTVFLFQEIGIIYAPHGLGTRNAHIKGMNTLLQYCRSKSSDDPIINTIHRHRHKLRLIISSTGMSLSKAERDYLMEPTNGDPLLEILQTTVAIGDLKSLIESIESSHEDLEPSQIAAILWRCYEIRDLLMGLRQDGRLGKEPHQLQPIQEGGMPSPGPLFGFGYDFSLPNDALLFVMFWVHLVLLHPLICHLKSLPGASAIQDCATSQFQDLDFDHPEKYADEVARAMPYCLQESMKSSFSKVAAFSLCIISLNYVETGNRVKHEWVLEFIRNLAARGFDVSTHLVTLMAAQWERRWVAGDSNVSVSLREMDCSVCDLDPVPLFDTESDLEYGSMYDSNSSLVIEEIFD